MDFKFPWHGKTFMAYVAAFFVLFVTLFNCVKISPDNIKVTSQIVFGPMQGILRWYPAFFYLQNRPTSSRINMYINALLHQ
jgi:hypothetical protein